MIVDGGKPAATLFGCVKVFENPALPPGTVIIRGPRNQVSVTRLATNCPEIEALNAGSARRTQPYHQAER